MMLECGRERVTCTGSKVWWLQVEALPPLVLDLWVEAVGSPLQFALRPPPPRAPLDEHHYTDEPPTLWVSAQDPEHTLHVRNTSRAPLAVHAYVLRDHEYVQDRLPFRVCVRLFDVAPATCKCSGLFQNDDDSMSSVCGEQSSSGGSAGVEMEMDTGVELYFAPDCGVQDGEYFQVWPRQQQVAPGERCSWRVTCCPPAAPPLLLPPHTLLLRTLPLQPRGYTAATFVQDLLTV
ncbi:uncharacterized protein LOC126381090 [Pectinophora gossypiella]|uniref:uncharacterized protein LOC126381090 n=1 Tax=Pectinophora gossypiella TaxID=13191 RepID=UPI00214F35D3|nr:uncharacterized protein LOC126381090 [Pectinophora gossypiella]